MPARMTETVDCQSDERLSEKAPRANRMSGEPRLAEEALTRALHALGGCHAHEGEATGEGDAGGVDQLEA